MLIATPRDIRSLDARIFRKFQPRRIRSHRTLRRIRSHSSVRLLCVDVSLSTLFRNAREDERPATLVVECGDHHRASLVSIPSSQASVLPFRKFQVSPRRPGRALKLPGITPRRHNRAILSCDQPVKLISQRTSPISVPSFDVGNRSIRVIESKQAILVKHYYG